MSCASVLVMQQSAMGHTVLWEQSHASGLEVSHEQIFEMVIGDPLKVHNRMSRGEVTKMHRIYNTVMVSSQFLPLSMRNDRTATAASSAVAMCSEAPSEPGRRSPIMVCLFVTPSAQDDAACDRVYAATDFVVHIRRALTEACQSAVAELIDRLRLRDNHGVLLLPANCLRDHAPRFVATVHRCVEGIVSFFNTPFRIPSSFGASSDVLDGIGIDVVTLMSDYPELLPTILTAAVEHHAGWVAGYCASEGLTPAAQSRPHFAVDMDRHGSDLMSPTPKQTQLACTPREFCSPALAAARRLSGVDSAAGTATTTLTAKGNVPTMCRFLVICRDDKTARRVLSLLSYLVRCPTPPAPPATDFGALPLSNDFGEGEVEPIDLSDRSKDVDAHPTVAEDGDGGDIPSYYFAESRCFAVPFVACRILGVSDVSPEDVVEFCHTPCEPSQPYPYTAPTRCIVIDVDRKYVVDYTIPPLPFTSIRRVVCQPSRVMQAALQEIMCMGRRSLSKALEYLEGLLHETFLMAVVVKDVVESIPPSHLPIQVNDIMSPLGVSRDHWMLLVDLAAFLSPDIRAKLRKPRGYMEATY
eukprot:PhM_4_TR16353/c0_g1_i1/m.81803